MSQRFDTTVQNIRQILGDTNIGDPVFASEHMRRLVNMSTQKMAAESGLGFATATITMVAGTKDYALSSSIQYAQTFQLVRTADFMELEKLSLEQVNRELELNPTGTPEQWAVSESTAQAVTVRVCPVPTASDAGRTLTLWLSQIPDDATGASSAIPFSNLLMKAVEADVASTLLMLADEEMLNKIKKSKTAAIKLESDAARLLKLERVRNYRRKRTANFVLGIR